MGWILILCLAATLVLAVTVYRTTSASERRRAAREAVARRWPAAATGAPPEIGTASANERKREPRFMARQPTSTAQSRASGQPPPLPMTPVAESVARHALPTSAARRQPPSGPTAAANPAAKFSVEGLVW